MRGISLIELLITLAIVAVLAAIALPGYSQVINRALRQDARLALLRIHHRQENFFSRHLVYARQLAGADGLQMPDRSERRHYRLQLRTSQDGTRYTAVAVADPAGRQATDEHCLQLSIDETGRRGSADAAGNWREDDPWRCWQ